MSVLAEAMIAAFYSNSEIVWSLESIDKVVARFVVSESKVTVTFDLTGAEAWRVSFDVDSKTTLSNGMDPSIRIFSGVFQAVKEFLEMRQPERLIFASKQEAIYETYLSRQGTELQRMGYKSDATKMSLLAEFSILKTTQSAWKAQ